MADEEQRLAINEAEPQYPCCHPKRHYRWGVLAFITLLTFGSYFSYDNPTALQCGFESWRTTVPDGGCNITTNPLPPGAQNLTDFQFNMLYSIYSWPNTILSMVGGILIDKLLGIRFGAFFFAMFCLVGQCIFAIGSMVNSFGTMVAGRFVFGLGGENLAVTQNAYTVKYFSGKELNLVFGLGLSIARIGSTVNLNIENPIASQYGLPFALWVGAFLCLFSVTDSVILWLLDRHADKLDPPKEPVKAGEKISLRYILNFPLTLWIIFFICVFFYVAIFPFIANVGTLLQSKRFGMTQDAANTAKSLPYLISGGASPVFGFVVDFIGYNPIFVTMASCLVLGAFFLLSFTSVTPYVAMSIIGVAYSMCACALWPMVGYMVKRQQLGTAYGIMQSVQNLGLAVVPLAVGALLQADPSFGTADWFFIGCMCMSILLCILLMVIDWRGAERRLMLSKKGLVARRERLAAEAEIRAAEEEKKALLE